MKYFCDVNDFITVNVLLNMAYHSRGKIRID